MLTGRCEGALPSHMTPSWIPPEVTLYGRGRGEDLRNAAELGIAVAAARNVTEWQLVAGPMGIELHAPTALGGLSVALNAAQGPLARRLRGARREDPLARAVGLQRQGPPPRVLDACAGLCRDAMVLAELGCSVLALERIPALVLLARSAALGLRSRDRLRIECAAAEPWLAKLPADQAPAVVYLDPMFEEGGDAAVKKDLQVLRLLAGPPDDPAALFAAARAVARERVVVKRHGRLPPLAEGVSFVVPGERVRFDVYLNPVSAGPATPPP
ncbi:MAG: class I SAM-dependent methyltransferase [Planctomycetes bacterium]|nr:class I SAM-dependent methyltransferase [Planctomycetota bacterium]